MDRIEKYQLQAEFLHVLTVRHGCLISKQESSFESCPLFLLKHKSQCPLMGKGVGLSRTYSLCWQPSGHALYNKPIRIKSKLKSIT